MKKLFSHILLSSFSFIILALFLPAGVVNADACTSHTIIADYTFENNTGFIDFHGYIDTQADGENNNYAWGWTYSNGNVINEGTNHYAFSLDNKALQTDSSGHYMSVVATATRVIDSAGTKIVLSATLPINLGAPSGFTNKGTCTVLGSGGSSATSSTNASSNPTQNSTVNPNSGTNTNTNFNTGATNSNATQNCNLDAANPTQICNPLPVTNIKDLILQITKYVMGIIAVLSVVMIIFAGFRMVISGGNEKAVGAAKSMIVAAVSGLVVSLLAFTIIAIVQNVLTTK